MELYQAYTDYYGMMDSDREYVPSYCKGGYAEPPRFRMQTLRLILGKPFERLTMVDAIKKYAGVDFDEIQTTEEAKKLADEKGVHYEERHVQRRYHQPLLRGVRRRAPDPADLYHGSSGRDLTADQEESRINRSM